MPSHIVGCFRFSILCKMQWPLGGQNNPQWMQARSEAPRRVCVMLPNVLCCFQCVMQYANTGFENSSFSSGLGRIYCTACFPSFYFLLGHVGHMMRREYFPCEEMLIYHHDNDIVLFCTYDL